METSITVSHWHAAIGDTIACTVQDVNRPEGDYDQSAGDVNEQLNPRFPLSGFEQIYLVDVSGPIGRWLHPRHVEVSISYMRHPSPADISSVLYQRPGVHSGCPSLPSGSHSLHICCPRLPLLCGYVALTEE